jgi:DNA-binding transcriptional ArsR family regulator
MSTKGDFLSVAQQGVFYMEEYKGLQQFESMDAMNAHIKATYERFADELNRTAMDVLDYLAQHACKVYGVAYVKAATIAEALSKGYRTVTTATKTLADLGIIKKVEVMRKKTGGKGANVYVINAVQPNVQPIELPIGSPIVEEAVEPTAVSDEQPKNEGTNSFKSSSKSSLKSLNKKSETHASAHVVKIGVQLFPNIPERIKHSLSLLQDNELGNAIWKKVIQAYVQSDLYNELGNVHLQKVIEEDDVFYAALTVKIHNVVAAQAHGQVRTDVLGFIYGTCKGYFNDEAIAIIEANAPDFSYDDYLTLAIKRMEEGARNDYNERLIYRQEDKFTTEEMNANGLF